MAAVKMNATGMIFQTPHNFFFFKTCDCGCLQNKSLHKAHSWWYTSWVYVVMSHESYISFKISSGMSIKHQSKVAAQHIRRRLCTRKVVYISYTTAHWKIICARRFTSSKKILMILICIRVKKKKKRCCEFISVRAEDVGSSQAVWFTPVSSSCINILHTTAALV